MERELADRAIGRWIDTESKSLSIPAQEKLIARLFSLAPLKNFRDTDEPAQFPVWYPSQDAFIAVTGRLIDDDSDAEQEKRMLRSHSQVLYSYLPGAVFRAKIASTGGSSLSTATASPTSTMW
jgi:hypothetical protein